MAKEVVVVTELTECFAPLLVAWQKKFGRNNLPWQVPNPYYVWVSEVMLQQTQVKTVLSYFPKFIQRFPDISSLSQASIEEVLTVWAGLGYYSRARNLHSSAQCVMQKYAGNFPSNRLEWEQLKGVGRSTAAAIVAFSFKQREAILDGNVKRILARMLTLPVNIAESSSEKKMWKLAEKLLPKDTNDMPNYIQGLMDLGALVCTKHKPQCPKCPMTSWCLAYQDNKVHLYPVNKKKINIKKLDFFWPIIINQNNEIMLQERKSVGIWPGLLTPPTFESKAKMLQWLEQKPYMPISIQELPRINHKLTHRELTIRPFEVQLKKLEDKSFYPVKQILQERIPKPLKSFLLQRYFSANSL